MGDAITVGNLEIRVQKKDGKIAVVWTGEAESADPSQEIRPFLEQSKTLASASTTAFTMDLSGVIFMNSACTGFLINFLRSLEELGLPLEVIYDTSVTWQIHSMRCSRAIFARSKCVTVTDRSGKF